MRRDLPRDRATATRTARRKIACYTRTCRSSLSSSSSYTTLSDSDLVTEVARLAGCERHATAQLIASLAELDARRLYLGQGCSSMFTYCTQVLRLSEHAAYNRIEAARAARRFPVILDRLADGSITLTTVCLLASHLTPDNHRDLLEAARLKSKRDVEVLVAGLRPQPPVPSLVRKLPATSLAPPADLTAPTGPGQCRDNRPRSLRRQSRQTGAPAWSHRHGLRRPHRAARR